MPRSSVKCTSFSLTGKLIGQCKLVMVWQQKKMLIFFSCRMMELSGACSTSSDCGVYGHTLPASTRNVVGPLHDQTSTGGLLALLK